MTRQVRRLGGRFGARLEEIDFDQPLGDAEIEAIADALHNHEVLTFEP
jgi:alpha-ketoglutarate-dependent taurine dioxygenase